GMGESERNPDYNLRVRRTLAGVKSDEEEWALKEKQRYGGGEERNRHWEGGPRPQAHFGLTVVSCEHGDIRQSLHGLYVYGDAEKWEVPVEDTLRGRAAELEELYGAVIEHRPVFHDGRWGIATLEVVLGIMQSARERKEVYMSHQVPSPE